MKSKLIKLIYLLSLISLSANGEEYSAAPLLELTLENAVTRAQQNDLWLVKSRHSQDALESMSLAAATLPDPKVSLNLANIAADNFDFNQEAMSQFKLGVSQMFPRGDTLALKQQQLKLMASQYPYQRQDRQAKVAVTVASLWLDGYQAQQSIALIEKDRDLFEQLADVAEASYSSAIGKTRQQDIVRAQLELTRLDDRLTQLKQKKEVSQQQLFEWLNKDISAQIDSHLFKNLPSNFAKQLPNIDLLNESLVMAESNKDPQVLYQHFVLHPSVKSLEKQVEASESSIELAKQQYKPEWGINAGYGYRDKDPQGLERSDLFTIGVTFDIPLFTSNRQDKQLQSAVSKTAAVKTEKWLLIRKMIAAFETSKAKLHRLNQRQKLYQERLMPQMHDQAEASLNAYTHDDGDFAEVVRARIAELNAAIDVLAINVERQKSIVQLNYYLKKSASINNPKLTGLGENQ